MPWHLRTIIKIFLLLIPVYIYAGFRFSKSISTIFSISASSARIAVFSVIIFLNLFPVLILAYSWSGNMGHFFTMQNDVNWQDYLFLYPFWITLIVIVEIVPYYFLVDIISLIFRLSKFAYYPQLVKWGSMLRFGVTIFFVVYVSIISYWDTNRISVKEYRVPIQNLPEGLENINMALLGDVQVDRYTQGAILSRLEEKVENADSDILLFAGDLVTSGEKYIDQGLELLCGLQASISRVSCLGDHDYWANAERVASGLEKCGWNFLNNQHHMINHKGRKILITGVVYIYSKKISSRQLNDLLNAAPAADVKILLVHQPALKVIESAKEHGYDLVVAGHTHGGQMVFKPFGFSLTPTMFENKHFSGYSDRYGIPVIITNGIGLTLAPLRYHAPAEVSEISLVNK